MKIEEEKSPKSLNKVSPAAIKKKSEDGHTDEIQDKEVPRSQILKYLAGEIFGWKNVILTISAQFTFLLWSMGTKKWLTYWSKNSLNFTNTFWYPVIYLLLNLISIAIFVTRIRFFCNTVANGSQIIFKKLISRLLRRPLEFYESTPSGKIIQRCITDISIMDFHVPKAMIYFLNAFFMLLSSYFMMIFMNPANIIVIFVSSGYCWHCLIKYSKVSQKLTAMKENSVNPVISAVNELVSGSRTIRTFGKTEYLKRKLVKKIDCQLVAQFHENVFLGWPKSRFEYSFLLLISVTISFIYYSKVKSIASISEVGGEGAQTGSYGILINSFLRASAISDQICYYILNLIALMGSVSRLYDYAENGELEENLQKSKEQLYPALESQKIDDDENWPS